MAMQHRASHYGTGRRKSAVARVHIRPGKGAITVEQVLSHQAGLPLVEAPLGFDETLAWYPVVETLASQSASFASITTRQLMASTQFDLRRKLDADAARAFHELQILFGKGQHRNARQIDLLRAGKMQQQIERPLEGLELDGKRVGRGLELAHR